MNKYNDLANIASALFQEDTVLNGQLVLMPDENLQMYKFNPLAMPNDLPCLRLESRLSLLIDRLEFVLNEQPETHVPLPQTRAARQSGEESIRVSEQSVFAWDAFIAHASEDKEPFVRELAVALQKDFRIWYDEFTLTVGDRLRRKIDEGLAKSRYGIVVLSKNFFNKHWPEEELDGLASREVNGRKVILPVWLDVGYPEVCEYSVTLAGRLAARAELGLPEVLRQLAEVLREGASDSSQYPDTQASATPRTEQKDDAIRAAQGSAFETVGAAQSAKAPSQIAIAPSEIDPGGKVTIVPLGWIPGGDLESLRCSVQAPDGTQYTREINQDLRMGLHGKLVFPDDFDDASTNIQGIYIVRADRMSGDGQVME